LLRRDEISKLDDYFTDSGKRRNRCGYFYRINGYNLQVREFIRRYYEATRLCGVVIEGKLNNPDRNNLAYYNEIMGSDFQLNSEFIKDSLKKWLPRISMHQRENLASSICSTLNELKQSGKNDNMLKNAYIKFMCWLYYRFEGIISHLGEEKLPKILYEGNIGSYELLLMDVLFSAGCDIVLLQYSGDDEYLKLDADSSRSIDLKLPGMTAFPADFSLKSIRQDILTSLNNERLYGVRSQFNNCTNAWITGKLGDDIRKEFSSRGSDSSFFYNCFCRITGVEDKVTYLNELYQLSQDLKHSQRKIVIVNREIVPPSPEEINSIRRSNYKDVSQMISELSSNLSFLFGQELRRIANKTFVDIMLEESRVEGMNINRLTTMAVYMLCWLKRYHLQLFSDWKMPQIAVFFYMGGCRNNNESVFCRFLARLPVDVVIFNPDLSHKCSLQDELLYEVNYDQSLAVSEYPEENSGLRVGTVAYHAERDLDTMVYENTGIYRNQQYSHAAVVILQTMYEEISVLWDQELKYRPNFSTVDSVVNIPVIFAKISGVKDNDLTAYWSSIKKLITQDTAVVTTIPNIASDTPNPVKEYATEFFKNGKVLKSKIKSHKVYQYSFLRDNIQDYILDKLQLLIDQKIIKGTFENGTEYTIVSTVLNLDKDILRMIQKFDFTKKNPKLIYIIAGETMLSLEDTISAAFLNQIGFDILFFVPTGYQCIERYFNRNLMEEHQIGEYVFDLKLPNFNKVSSDMNNRSSWFDFIFKWRK
jgi:hypothetical protein